MKTVAEVLDGAADLLEKPGAWTQGNYRKGDCMCMVGALQVAAGAVSAADVESGPVANVVHAVLAGESLTNEYGGFGLFVWNDRPGRTQAEVVAKLREAATLARQAPTHD